MKFVCEQCKTRYSIADERVAGRVLKIRCKTCGFVITVREGMGADGAGGQEVAAPSTLAGSARPGRPTTLAPRAMPEVTPEAQDAADEWYVSIDGKQHGPFQLEGARGWVGKHLASADLHCWKEGFADWLPVESVPELAGLRARPTPSVPPPRRAPAPTPAQLGQFEKREALSARPDPFAAAMAAAPNAEVRDLTPAQVGPELGGDDDLAIGEVSRVVKLADLAKSAPPRASAPAVRKVTNPGVTSSPLDPVTANLAAAAKAADADHLEPPLAQAVQARKHSNVFLWVVMVGLTAAVAVGVVVLLTRDQEGGQIAYGSGNYDGIGERPSVIIRQGGALVPAVPTPGGRVGVRPSNPSITTNPGAGTPATGNGKTEFLPGKDAVTSLRPEEVQDMVQRNGDSTRRCYEAAQRKDPFLDVKKLMVTMVIDKSGVVSDVQLSDKAEHALGKCLVARIKNWKFRESTAGLTSRISVVFVGG